MTLLEKSGHLIVLHWVVHLAGVYISTRRLNQPYLEPIGDQRQKCYIPHKVLTRAHFVERHECERAHEPTKRQIVVVPQIEDSGNLDGRWNDIMSVERYDLAT